MTAAPPRSAAILAALQKEIAERRNHLDTATDLVEVTVTVKLMAGMAWVRGIEYREERVMRVRGER